MKVGDMVLHNGVKKIIWSTSDKGFVLDDKSDVAQADLKYVCRPVHPYGIDFTNERLIMLSEACLIIDPCPTCGHAKWRGQPCTHCEGPLQPPEGITVTSDGVKGLPECPDIDLLKSVLAFATHQ